MHTLLDNHMVGENGGEAEAGWLSNSLRYADQADQACKQYSFVHGHGL
jgi:hypothetical protein